LVVITDPIVGFVPPSTHVSLLVVLTVIVVAGRPPPKYTRRVAAVIVPETLERSNLRNGVQYWLMFSVAFVPAATSL
jgi:hypothetical protein